MEIDIGGGYWIRSWKRGDEVLLARYGNNRKVWRNLRDSFPHPYGVDDGRQWIRHCRAQAVECYFAMADGAGPVGAIGLDLQEDIFRRSAELGYWLGEPFWGRGIATKAVSALSGYAFREMGLLRLYAYVFEENGASSRVLEKAGFALEGRLRCNAIKEGRLRDQRLYALLSAAIDGREGGLRGEKFDSFSTLSYTSSHSAFFEPDTVEEEPCGIVGRAPG